MVKSAAMDSERILLELKGEIARLQRAVDALEEAGSSSRTSTSANRSRRGGRRPGFKLSVAARKRIAAAQRARWAKVRKEQKGG